LIRAVDEYRDPEMVCEELRSWVDRLERGAVDPNELVITNRVSKKLEDYSQSTRSVAALKRATNLGLARALTVSKGGCPVLAVSAARFGDSPSTLSSVS
jgi:DNA polymerase, archaea type